MRDNARCMSGSMFSLFVCSVCVRPFLVVSKERTLVMSLTRWCGYLVLMGPNEGGDVGGLL